MIMREFLRMAYGGTVPAPPIASLKVVPADGMNGPYLCLPHGERCPIDPSANGGHGNLRTLDVSNELGVLFCDLCTGLKVRQN